MAGDEVNEASGASPPDEEKQQHFRLLDLPMELVVRVLEFTVITSSAQEPVSIEGREADCQKLLNTPITRSCRILRREGLSLFYTKNVFRFEARCKSIVTMFGWLRNTEEANARSIQTLWMQCMPHLMAMNPTRRDLLLEMKLMDALSFPELSAEAFNNIHVRGSGGRLFRGAAGLGRCYQLLWKDGKQDHEGWIRCADFAATEISQLSKEESRSADIWMS